MGIVISNLRQIEKELNARGYQGRPYRRGLTGIRILTKDDKGVLIVSSIEIDAALRQPISVSVDDYFTELSHLIETMKNRTISDIVFAGGGSVPIPQDFMNWCAKQNIKVHISSPNEPVRSENIGR